ncbi:hypothetical protein P152DRAFT_501549 [Eremomyces bilateralis CBS 781.70]|uniref:Uncharacterized protein n=1 Tax=Eremomyces bilateralis CBS 781.70 TaxID=1392243 RepID=A0A6G1G738_9PEZI|nr:uncharacterized protein P152DRAFT_501549 [Eremomyces bilateralis CBS 781.70]KAF1813863.1 hypothetical protein P152DRAFT_501549 [Eremomyces bilateralis CBS 781.70]
MSNQDHTPEAIKKKRDERRKRIHTSAVEWQPFFIGALAVNYVLLLVVAAGYAFSERSTIPRWLAIMSFAVAVTCLTAFSIGWMIHLNWLQDWTCFSAISTSGSLDNGSPTLPVVNHLLGSNCPPPPEIDTEAGITDRWRPDTPGYGVQAPQQVYIGSNHIPDQQWQVNRANRVVGIQPSIIEDNGS